MRGPAGSPTGRGSRKPGKRPAVFWLLLLLPLCAAPPAGGVGAAPAIAIVARKGGNAMVVDRTALANIYRRTVRVDDHGQVYVPVNLPAMHPLRRAFSLALFKQAPEDMETYWNEQYFHGVSPPFVLASTEAVIRFIAATPGALGYVLDCRLDDRLEVLMTLRVSGIDQGLGSSCDGPEPGSGE